MVLFLSIGFTSRKYSVLHSYISNGLQVWTFALDGGGGLFDISSVLDLNFRMPNSDPGFPGGFLF